MDKSRLKMSKARSVNVKLFDIVKVSDEEYSRSLPIRVAESMSNIEYDKGDIKRRYAFAPMKFADGSMLPAPPGQVAKVFFFHGAKGDKSIVIINIMPKATYCIDLDKAASDWTIINYYNFDTGDEFRLIDENVMILNGEFDGCEYIWNDIRAIYTYVDGVGINEPTSKWTMICSHYSRNFVVTASHDYRVYFSAVGDIVDFTVAIGKGGYINVDINYGKIIKLLSFNEYLYIFLERGIMRLRAYGDQREFLLKKLDVNSGIIIASSIISCGDRIIFMSSRGVMVFDGYSASPMLTELTESLYNKLVASEYVSAAFVENNYCISYSEHGHGRMIVIDIFNRSYCYFDIDNYRTLCRESQGREELILFGAAVDSNEDASHAPVRMQSYRAGDEYVICPDGVMVSGRIDFDSADSYKNIRNIISSDSDYIIMIEDDRGLKHRVKVKRGDNHVNIRSKYFIFTVILPNQCDRIVSPYLNVEFARD